MSVMEVPEDVRLRLSALEGTCEMREAARKQGTRMNRGHSTMVR